MGSRGVPGGLPGGSPGPGPGLGPRVRARGPGFGAPTPRTNSGFYIDFPIANFDQKLIARPACPKARPNFFLHPSPSKSRQIFGPYSGRFRAHIRAHIRAHFGHMMFEIGRLPLLASEYPHPPIGPKSAPKLVPTWPQVGPKLDPNRPQIGPTSTQIGPTLAHHWLQNGPTSAPGDPGSPPPARGVYVFSIIS